MGRALAAVAAAVLVAVAALVVVSLSGSEHREPPHLVIYEIQRWGEGRFIEGEVSFLNVSRAGDGRAVFHGMYPNRPIRLDRNLPAGRYRLVSYMRSCAVGCIGAETRNLDPFAIAPCSATVDVKPSGHTKVTLYTSVSQPCRFRVQ